MADVVVLILAVIALVVGVGTFVYARTVTRYWIREAVAARTEVARLHRLLQEADRG